jgi:hypothetical protein
VLQKFENRAISQLEETPLPYTETVHEGITEHFPGLWIGRGGSKPWPSQSPDLTPTYFLPIELCKTSSTEYENQWHEPYEVKNKRLCRCNCFHLTGWRWDTIKLSLALTRYHAMKMYPVPN